MPNLGVTGPGSSALINNSWKPIALPFDEFGFMFPEGRKAPKWGHRCVE